MSNHRYTEILLRKLNNIFIKLYKLNVSDMSVENMSKVIWSISENILFPYLDIESIVLVDYDFFSMENKLMHTYTHRL